MKRWSVCDRDGRKIYLTKERWEHITSRHCELSGLLDDVLDTIRLGRRQQEPRDPQTYRYTLRCDKLPAPFNHIIVIVAFRFHNLPDGTTVANNFVVSAWGKYLPTRD